nr:basic salivary proline-rich protein 2-like [Camelus dromedarius]
MIQVIQLETKVSQSPVQQAVSLLPKPSLSQYCRQREEEAQASWGKMDGSRPLLYRCTPWPEIARPTAQTGDFGIKEAPVGRDSTQDAGPTGPFPESGPPHPPARPPAPTATPARPGGLPGAHPAPPAILPAAAPPQPSPGTDTVEGGARAPGKLTREPPRGSPARIPASVCGQTRAPGPVARSPPPRRRAPRSCAPPSGTGSSRVASARQAAGVRGAGCECSSPPTTPPLACTGSGPGWSAWPSGRSSSLGFPPLSVRSEWQRGGPPPAPLRQTGQGWQDAAPTARGEGVGKGGGGIRHEWARRPPRPTVVPTQRGRGREEPQPEGRGHASPLARPRGPARRDHPHTSGPTVCGAGERSAVGAGVWRSGGAALRGAADGYRPPLGVCEPQDCSVSAPLPPLPSAPCPPARHPSGMQMGEGCSGPSPVLLSRSGAAVGRKVGGGPTKPEPLPLF